MTFFDAAVTLCWLLILGMALYASRSRRTLSTARGSRELVIRYNLSDLPAVHRADPVDVAAVVMEQEAQLWRTLAATTPETTESAH